MTESLKTLSNPAIFRIKSLLFLVCLIPLASLLAAAFSGGLGADPVETLTRSTGTWTLNFLMLTLAVTPFRKISGWCWLVRLRRMLGLYAFFYACLHFGTYLVFDQFFDWPSILQDVGKRPYIAAGFVAFLLLIPLAVTSTDGMMRRLGGRCWRCLHRLVFPIALAGVFHYLWLVKRDVTGPAWYAIVLCLLLMARVVGRRRPSKLDAPTELPSMSGGSLVSSALQRSEK